MVREIYYRKLKSVDLDKLLSGLNQSGLCSKEYADVTELTSAYNMTLSFLLDKHAPLKRKAVVCRQRVRWFIADIKAAVQMRRKKILGALASVQNRTTYLMNEARRHYHSNIIAENSSNQRKLFRNTNTLLREQSDVTFPQSTPPIELAIKFGNYFLQKTESICRKWDALAPSGEPDAIEEACVQRMLALSSL